MSTTEPPAFRNAGQASIVKRRAPWSLSASPASHCSSVISKRSICGTAPAMLRSASMRPNAASVRSTTTFAAARSARSRSTINGVAPAAVTAAATSSNFRRLRATSTMDVKSRASRNAVDDRYPGWPP
jgi:hypothetical protein